MCAQPAASRITSIGRTLSARTIVRGTLLASSSLLGCAVFFLLLDSYLYIQCWSWAAEHREYKLISRDGALYIAHIVGWGEPHSLCCREDSFDGWVRRGDESIFDVTEKASP